MEKDDLLEEFFGQLMEHYKQHMNENEEAKELYRKVISEGDAFGRKLGEVAPELVRQYEDYFGIMAERHDMEEKFLYQQGARDIVKLLKQVGVL